VNRRDFLIGAGVAACARRAAAAGPAPGVGASHPLQRAWRAWKAAHLAPEGRVVDGYQGGVSHSEGQGYGMTLAALFGDAPAFEAMRVWTETNLAVRDDPLLAWRWSPDAAIPTPDRNNASDGDLFYAWALLLAAERFGVAEHAARAATHAAALAALCLAERPDASGRVLLLPGVEGFRTSQGVIVNPSYAMPRALRELADAAGIAALADCADDAASLLDEMTATGLAPDWAEVTAAGWRPTAGRSSDNGYEAMRVPLFLIWSGDAGRPAVARQAEAQTRAAASEEGAAVVFARESGMVMERSVHPGYAALAGLTVCARSRAVGAAIPPFDPAQPYFPATLHLMALVAQIERAPRCFPL